MSSENYQQPVSSAGAAVLTTPATPMQDSLVTLSRILAWIVFLIACAAVVLMMKKLARTNRDWRLAMQLRPEDSNLFTKGRAPSLLARGMMRGAAIDISGGDRAQQKSDLLEKLSPSIEQTKRRKS